MNKTLELLATAKDQASAVLGKVGGAVSGLGSIAAGAATGGLALAGAAIVGLGAAAVGAGVLIFNFAQDTDKAMKLFGAQTGIAAGELGEFKEIAKDVYAAGLGESIGDVVDQMALVHKGMGETGDELEASTRRAMTLAEVFEVDVAESVKWVSSMTKSWGIDSEEAFDILTRGMQMGLDVADDLGDTLHEYSGDFDRLGISADQVLSMLNAGLEEGAYNTDVIADGWREYGIRLTEGGDRMTETFASMGIDFEAMSASVAAGDETWGDYAGTITAGLMNMEDELERNAAGVAIFGTKWEDVGGDVFMASGQAMEGVEGLGGATDDAAEAMATGLGPALERLKRTFLTEFAPLGDLVGEVIADKVVPMLETAAKWLGENVPIAVKWLSDKWEEFWPKAQATLIGFWTAIQPALNWLQSTFQAFTSTYLPLLRDAWDTLKEGFGEISDLYNTQLKPALQDLWDALGIGQTETGGIASAFGTFEGILAGIYASGIIETIKLGIQGITLAVDLGTKAIRYMKEGFGRLKRGLDAVKRAIQSVRDWVNKLKNSFSGLTLPSWLTPGSATPLELGLLDIGKAFAKLDKVPAVNWMTQPATGGRAASATGAVTSVHINFGRDSVRSDEDMRYIIDGVQRTLELQGLRARIN